MASNQHTSDLVFCCNHTLNHFYEDGCRTNKVERYTLRRKTLPSALLALLSLGAPFGSSEVQAQECTDTPEGPVCRIRQPLRSGTVVDVDTQHRLGLITINGCSGTLLNQHWLLTARHCVTQNGMIGGPLVSPDQVRVTADWAPSRVGIASSIRDFAVNTGPGVTPGSDIVLVHLGAADLGEVNSQLIYVVARETGPGSVVLSGRLTTADRVTQYGRGFDTFATGVFGGMPAAVPSGGLGVYRGGPFTPSAITNTGYTLAMNANSQVGHGGDSGGPTVVTVNGIGVGIAGVQSTCTATGYVPNAPVRNWNWATGISACQYVSTEPFVSEITNTIRETSVCTLGPVCSIPAIIRAAMRAAD
ncbi:trypsin-like serine protease [Methylobacter sp. YRD-M1]|uniref:trypsin-like serine protease n=1 Tax=Methylobacter sp. YRD-M1 TaxID=2911520 RepID=UPI00227C41AC|nr:trypsin-like serine protease [Methylobacter sp. YRD-M1]WAK02130.1 S1 family peptidase [Methylobacter sp. YRD-M1]